MTIEQINTVDGPKFYTDDKTIDLVKHDKQDKLKQLAKDLFDYGKEYYGEKTPQQITDTIVIIEDTIDMFYK
jgi:hypothetical protein